MTNTTIREEHAHSINGVSGRMCNAIVWPHALDSWANQQWVSERRQTARADESMRVTIRFDDNCKNGHATFSITCDIFERGRDVGGGAAHEAIAETFPELASLIKWHLVSTDGPMHYAANTVYHASNRDYNGLLAGEKRQIINGRTKLPAWHLVAVDEAGNEIELYKIEKTIDSTEQPECPYTLEYRPWCRVGEGKERDFQAARSSAVWPDATDEVLSLPAGELREKLAERLPALINAFRQDVEAAGFLWSPAQAQTQTASK